MYDEVAVVQIYYDVLHKFKQEHPNFIGGKVIYAPLRAANDSQFQIYLDTCTELHVSICRVWWVVVDTHPHQPAPTG